MKYTKYKKYLMVCKVVGCAGLVKAKSDYTVRSVETGLGRERWW